MPLASPKNVICPTMYDDVSNPLVSMPARIARRSMSRMSSGMM
jgi:hypothetical protein